MKNVGNLDRGIRLIVGEIVFLLAFFWIAPVWSIVLYVVASVLLFTAFIGFCPLYRALHIDTLQGNTGSSKKFIPIVTLLFLTILFSGAYASNFFTKKIFVEDFNTMNVFYKQTLFETGQEKRTESIKNYDSLVLAYAEFQDKYSSYRPYAFLGDAQFEEDLNAIDEIIFSVRTEVGSGSLKDAHLKLEKVRPIAQEMFKRNGFSMLSIVLIDFHDSMEKVTDPASAKDAAGVINAYQEASDKLMAVEQIENDQEIRTIRTNLEAVLRLAKENNLESLPAKGAELKSSFVKVYLKRG